MILRYEMNSFNETKQAKLLFFQYWYITMMYFTKIIAHQNFVYLIFQRHKILSKLKLNIFPQIKYYDLFQSLKIILHFI